MKLHQMKGNWILIILTLFLAGSKRLSLWRGGASETPPCYLEKLPTDFDGVNDIQIAVTCSKFWAPENPKNQRWGVLGGKTRYFFNLFVTFCVRCLWTDFDGITAIRQQNCLPSTYEAPRHVCQKSGADLGMKIWGKFLIFFQLFALFTEVHIHIGWPHVYAKLKISCSYCMQGRVQACELWRLK